MQREKLATISQCPTWQAKDRLGREVLVNRTRKPGQPYGWTRPTRNGREQAITKPDTVVSYLTA